MPSPFFRFKSFTVFHDRCAMKVGTDGVLLGASAPLAQGPILDIGTGSGVVALMLAQKNPLSQVIAIEIDPASAAQAAENFASSPFTGRLSMLCTALQEYRPDQAFDLITCNPPYFKVTSSSGSKTRNIARQHEKLDLSDIFSFARQHLSNSGSICIIYPSSSDLEPVAQSHGFFCSRKLFIKGMPHLAEKRIIWTFRKSIVPFSTSTLIIEISRHQYSDDFTALLKDFYLNF